MSNGTDNDPIIPAWFSLSKYEKASSLSFVEWALNLGLREELLYVFSDPENREKTWLDNCKAEWALLTEVGVLTHEQLSEDVNQAKQDVLKSMKIDGGHGKGLVFRFAVDAGV